MSSTNPTNPIDDSAVATPNTRSKRNRNMIAAVGLGMAAFLGLGVFGASGAIFNDVDTARVDINTATVVLGVSDADNSGTIDLDFNNLKPGQLLTQSFNVRNDGTIPATAYLGSNFTNSTPAENLDYSKLRVGVGTTSGQIALTSVTNLPAGWDLGVLAPGETKTFVVDVKLGGDAGNEWQGKVFGGNLPVTLTQQ
jgi:hypothetical protein